jgi:error-prone DNA polymerase
VRPIAVTTSRWHCSLEPSTRDPRQPAVRLGLELVQGLPEAAAQRSVAAREQRPFADTTDLAQRASLNRGEINALARAEALALLTDHRRQALWATLGIDADAPRSASLAARVTACEAQAKLLAPTEGRDIVADQAHTALTLRRHPLALPRDRLAAMRLATAKQVNRARKRQPIRAAGIVTCHLHKVRPAEAGRLLFRASRHSP